MTLKSTIRNLLPKSTLASYHRIVADLAAFIYRHPSRKLIVVGVTGTKGKSTVTNLVGKMLENLGNTVGFTSTINFKVDGREWLNGKKMTMLGRFALQKLLREMVDAGCRYAVIETSSEGIIQSRHRGIEYDIAVFTNLSPEHIESHGSFENYRDAKEKLFIHLTRFPKKIINGTAIPKIIVANSDDPESQRILAFTAEKKITYGIESPADLVATQIRLNSERSHFVIDGMQCSTSLIGSFNVMNALASLAVMRALNYSLADSVAALAAIAPLPGRQEWINEGQPFMVMVDYAYEPESQKKLYELIKAIPHQRIIHVTGSTGGGRDKSRRSVLGQIAGTNADIVVITNEDPYDDDPEEIVNQVAIGARESGKKDNESLFIVLDREQAIQKALALAQPHDFVLVTGKGCEQAMCVANGKKIPWDDRTVVKKYLKQRLITNTQTI